LLSVDAPALLAPGWLRGALAAFLALLILGVAGKLLFGLAPESAGDWFGAYGNAVELVVDGMLAAAGVLGVLALLRRLISMRREVAGLHRQWLDDLGGLACDGYWSTGADGRLAELSPDALRLLQSKPEELLGRYIDEIPGLAADEPVRASLRSALEKRDPLPGLTCSMRRADGSQAWVCFSGRPVFNAKGKFRGHFGFLRDVTERESTAARLRQSEQRLRALTALATEWYWETDAELRITQLHGPPELEARPKQAFLGRTLYSVFDDSVYRIDRGVLERNLVQRLPFRRVPYRIQRHKRPGFAYYETSGEPIFVEGEFAGFRGLSWDVSERESTIALLRESEERFRALTELSSDWYWEMDEQLRFTSMRQGGTRPLPFDESELIGRYRWDLPGELLKPATWDEHRRELDARRPFRDLLVRRQDRSGNKLYTLTAGDPVFDQSGRFCGYRGVGRNITEQVRAQERIERLATIDPITQLFNRPTFDERASRILEDLSAQQKNAALLFVDLDNFRMVNNVHGHRVGDQMLSIVARRMRRVIGESHLLGRRGGDELVALLVDVPRQESVVEVAKSLISAIGEPARVEEKEVSGTASLGIAIFPQDGVDLDSLLNHADAAMYQAKESRNTFQSYTPALARKSERRARLEQRLRKAVEACNFELYYQPLVTMADGKMMGAECLIRWRDEELGEVCPDEFVKVAEESGLIVELGDWVLREACRARREWHRRGLDVPPLSINMAGAQLAQLSCVDRLLETLAEFGVAPSEIEIEVTETSLFSLFKATEIGRDNLMRLRDAGVKIALDDFGVGHSSLSHLRELPIHRLKIDRTFTEECMKEAKTLTIVKAVIQMARSLMIRVTAEGIETQAQQLWMQHLGCESAQGFLFARPKPADEFLSHFLDRRGVGRERSLMH